LKTKGRGEIKHFLCCDKQKRCESAIKRRRLAGKSVNFSPPRDFLRLAFAPRTITLSLPNEKYF
jgi:hypothetical protein